MLALILSLLSFSAYSQELTDNRIRSFITTLEKAAAMEPEFEELNNSQDISSQQKAQMRAAMETGIGFTQQASAAPSADIEAVKPHLEALRAIAEQED
ncbi:MAG: hypothetical protein V7760_02110 [Marinobacter sp.]